MVRLFVGIEVPLSAAMALERLKGGVPGARWIDRENFHVTLTFIGDIDHEQAHEIDACLGEILAPSFAARLKGVGSFGRSKPHTLWAGIEAEPALAILQAATSRAVARAGVTPESRKFVPHVTLARFKNGDGAALGTYLNRHALFASDWFQTDRFVLFSSRPSRGGGPYAMERIYSLEGRPAEQKYAGP